MKINLTLLKLIKTLNLDIFNIHASKQFRILFFYYSIIIQKEFLGDINIQNFEHYLTLRTFFTQLQMLHFMKIYYIIRRRSSFHDLH